MCKVSARRRWTPAIAGGAGTALMAKQPTAGATCSTNNTCFYGLNAGVLAAIGTVTLRGGEVTTSVSGADGELATGRGLRC